MSDPVYDHDPVRVILYDHEATRNSNPNPTLASDQTLPLSSEAKLIRYTNPYGRPNLFDPQKDRCNR